MHVPQNTNGVFPPKLLPSSVPFDNVIDNDDDCKLLLRLAVVVSLVEFNVPDFGIFLETPVANKEEEEDGELLLLYHS